MQYCTNCGAAAREGAKFCTSCGVRLEPGVTLNQSPRDASQETATVYTAGPESAREPEPRRIEENDADSEETSYQASWPDAEAAPKQVQDDEEEQAGAGTAPSEAGRSGWPEPQTPETAGETSAEPEAEAEDSLAGWASEDTGATTDSDADRDLTRWDTEGDIETEDIEPEELRSDAGASEWEGWSPTPSPESAVHHHDDDSMLRDIRELVDALQRRLDRLADPIPLSARGVDADELAEQLNGWANEGPDSDELLWVIRDVRDNPRDIDALTRLADRAEELERLVERYGVIGSDARRWVARLRNLDGQTDI